MTEELNRVVAVVRAATAPPLTSEEARQQAQAEGLVLRKGGNKAGYSGVGFDQRSGRSKPYQAYVRRIGKQVKLGSFATAEEAALCVARSRLPEGQAAAEEAPRPLTPSNAEEGKGKPPAKPSIKEEGMAPLPSDAIAKEETGVLPLMPSGAIIKEEYEDERSDYQPKKQRAHY